MSAVPERDEVFRIGSVAGGSWEAFSRLVAVDFDARGNLYLLDAVDRRLVVVDSVGAFDRAIGRAGDGPGEYRSPVAMAVLPDGRVVVSDTGHRGFLLFDADGTYERSVPFGDGIVAPAVLFAHGEGAVVYAAREAMIARPGAGFAQSPPGLPLYRLDIDGEAEAELFHRAWLPPRPDPAVSGGPGGQTMVRRTTRAFEPELRAAMLPDGVLALADSTPYRIHLVRPGGGVEATLDRPVPPTPVTEREEALERARRLRELESGGGPQSQVMGMGPGGGGAPDPSQVRSMLEMQLEDMIFWPEIQVIRELAADPEGRLWVRRFGDVDEPGPIEILGRDGAVHAVVPPGAFEIPAAFGPDGLAAWIERDEVDVPFVRVARLVGVP